MSGFAVVFHRDGSPGAEAELGRTLGALSTSAPRQAPSSVTASPDDTWAVGLRPSVLELTGPERRVHRRGTGCVLVFDGRLDNRRQLEADTGFGADTSPARLLYHLGRDRQQNWTRVLGPLSLALWQGDKRRLNLYCDPVGGRTLYYCLRPDRLVAASDLAGVLAHGGVSRRLDRDRLTTLFSLSEPTGNRTFFADIRMLLPGELLVVEPERHRSVRLARIGGEPLERPRKEGFAEEYRALVAESVAACTRDGAATGVLLSGGLDSTAIAALAALAAERNPPPVALSWVFDRHPELDERKYFTPLLDRYDLASEEIPCDRQGPLGEPASWPVHPATPEQNPYRRFHQLSYAAARRRGLPIVLSGMLGDQLWSGTSRWLWDLVRQGRLRSLAREVWHHGRCAETGWRTLAAGFVPPRWRPTSRRQAPPWLTPPAARRYDDSPAWPPEHRDAPRPIQHLRLLGAVHPYGFSIERHFAGLEGVEMRYPYRDRRLIEFMLRLPTEELVRTGVRRPLHRRSLAHLLPQAVVDRQGKTSFSPIFHQGLERSGRWVERLLRRPDRLWDSFVEPTALESPRLRAETRSQLLWTCLSFELWRERIAPVSPTDCEVSP